MGSEGDDTRASKAWQQRLGSALRSLFDRSALNESSLARLPYVRRLALDRYSGRLMARGLALREVLLAAVDGVVHDIGDEPGMRRECDYLVLLREGLTCKEISARLGLSREHVSRVYRRKALALVAQRFLATVNGGD